MFASSWSSPSDISLFDGVAGGVSSCCPLSGAIAAGRGSQRRRLKGRQAVLNPLLGAHPSRLVTDIVIARNVDIRGVEIWLEKSREPGEPLTRLNTGKMFRSFQGTNRIAVAGGLNAMIL